MEKLTTALDDAHVARARLGDGGDSDVIGPDDIDKLREHAALSGLATAGCHDTVEWSQVAPAMTAEQRPGRPARGPFPGSTSGSCDSGSRVTRSSARSTYVRMLRGIGNSVARRSEAVCACQTPRIGPPASTSTTPATWAKQARAPMQTRRPRVDDAESPRLAMRRASAPPGRETCLHVFRVHVGRPDRAVGRRPARALLVPEGRAPCALTATVRAARFPRVLVWVIGSLGRSATPVAITNSPGRSRRAVRSHGPSRECRWPAVGSRTVLATSRRGTRPTSCSVDGIGAPFTGRAGEEQLNAIRHLYGWVAGAGWSNPSRIVTVVAGIVCRSASSWAMSDRGGLPSRRSAASAIRSPRSRRRLATSSWACCSARFASRSASVRSHSSPRIPARRTSRTTASGIAASARGANPACLTIVANAPRVSPCVRSSR